MLTWGFWPCSYIWWKKILTRVIPFCRPISRVDTRFSVAEGLFWIARNRYTWKRRYKGRVYPFFKLLHLRIFKWSLIFTASMPVKKDLLIQRKIGGNWLGEEVLRAPGWEWKALLNRRSRSWGGHIKKRPAVRWKPGETNKKAFRRVVHRMWWSARSEGILCVRRDD